MTLTTVASLLLGICLSGLQGVALAMQKRECELSGYCSLGISKVWTGDIRTGSALREMLEAVSYKKELIFTSMASPYLPAWGNMALQLQLETQYLGYGHFFVLTMKKDECDILQSLADGGVSCIWDSALDENKAMRGVERAWLSRWRLMARALRLGYNLMSVDNDFMFLRDPYIHLKRPPLSQHKMFGLRESGGPIHVNGGFMYVQNALPNGPITWIFRMVVENNAWIQDHDWQYFNQSGGTTWCMTDDQDMLLDAITSTVIGRPVAPRTIAACKPQFKSRGVRDVEVTTATALKAIEFLLNEPKRFNLTEVKPDPRIIHPYLVSYDDHNEILVTNLTVPNTGYGWPEELGGGLGPLPHGPAIIAWHDTLKSDCPSCPWWKDVRPIPGGVDVLASILNVAGVLGHGDAGSDEIKMKVWRSDLFWDVDMPMEQLVMAPVWFISSMKRARQGTISGYNNTNPKLQSAPVMVHMHVWPTCTLGGSEGKQHIRKIVGRHHWGLSTRVANHAGRPTPYMTLGRVQGLVALHPSLDLSRTRNVTEYHAIVTGLLQVAMLSNRTAVLPDLPCNTTWAHWSSPTTPLPSYLASYPVKQTSSGCLSHFTEPNVFGRYWNKDASPYAVPYLVDTQGDVLGGWLWGMDRARETKTHAAIREAAANLEGLPAGTGTPEALTEKLAAKEEEKWWREMRYRMILPHIWDVTCTRDLPALTRAEAAHWLSVQSSVQGSLGTNPRPSQFNTIFLPALDQEHLRLADLPPRELMAWADLEKEMSTIKSWSLADVQVALPAGMLVDELKRHQDLPIIYLGHPVGVLPGADWRRRRGRRLRRAHRIAVKHRRLTDAANHRVPETTSEKTASQESQADDWTSGDENTLLNQGTAQHAQQHRARMISHTKLLDDVNRRIVASRCKAAWEVTDPPDRNNPTHLIGFTNTKAGVLHAGRVTLEIRPLGTNSRTDTTSVTTSPWRYLLLGDVLEWHRGHHS